MEQTYPPPLPEPPGTFPTLLHAELELAGTPPRSGPRLREVREVGLQKARGIASVGAGSSGEATARRWRGAVEGRVERKAGGSGSGYIGRAPAG